MTVNDPITAYFDGLTEHGRQPLLRSTRGTIRFDLSGDGHTEHWRVAIDRGHIDIGRGAEAADCVVAIDKKLFDGVITGKVNTMAAVLRGQINVTGDLHLIVMLQRLFPARSPLPEHSTRRHEK